MSISGLLLLNLVFNIIHHVVEIGSLIVLYIYLAFLFAILSNISIKVILRLVVIFPIFSKKENWMKKWFVGISDRPLNMVFWGEKRRVKVWKTTILMLLSLWGIIAFSVFTQSLQSASQKVQKLSEIQECLAKKLAKTGYFSLFNSEIKWNIRENL